jgi:hypothetical protein
VGTVVPLLPLHPRRLWQPWPRPKRWASVGRLRALVARPLLLLLLRLTACAGGWCLPELVP